VFVLNSVLPDVGLLTIFKGVLPFWIADILRLILLLAVPGLSLWLVL
jgi:TRAP-type C4-dicarboxylate transport system permease large subunit